jgi:hypothetical protein
VIGFRAISGLRSFVQEALAARVHEVLEELFDVLVVNIELFFERIQIGIIEDPPPFAPQHGFSRPGDVPTFRVLVMGRNLFVSGW